MEKLAASSWRVRQAGDKGLKIDIIIAPDSDGSRPLIGGKIYEAPKFFYAIDQVSAEDLTHVRKPSRRAQWLYRVPPQGLTRLAVLIAGRKGGALGSEWSAHLSGETGRGLPVDQQVRDAAGFVRAAMRTRCQDIGDLLWRPVDTLLASRELSNLVVLLATLGVAVVFIRQGGLNGLADNLGSVAVVWGAAFGLIRVGRQWRDVKPPERKPRHRRQ